MSFRSAQMHWSMTSPFRDCKPFAQLVHRSIRSLARSSSRICRQYYFRRQMSCMKNLAWKTMGTKKPSGSKMLKMDFNRWRFVLLSDCTVVLKMKTSQLKSHTSPSVRSNGSEFKSMFTGVPFACCPGRDCRTSLFAVAH